MLRMKHFRRDTITLNDVTIHLMYFDSFQPTEYFDMLSEHEQTRLNTFGHIDRRREFVATRILKHQLFGYKKIEYSRNGAPYIENEGHISISHTKGCCAIAICERYKIGLDLEPQSEKAKKLFPKFLNEDERHFLDVSDALTMTCAWSCKEALYKLAGRRKLIFKTDLLLLNKVGSAWECSIRNLNETIFVNLISILKDELIITINTSAIEIDFTA